MIVKAWFLPLGWSYLSAIWLRSFNGIWCENFNSGPNFLFEKSDFSNYRRSNFPSKKCIKYIAENLGPTAVFELSDGFEKLTFELSKFDCNVASRGITACENRLFGLFLQYFQYSWISKCFVQKGTILSKLKVNKFWLVRPFGCKNQTKKWN